MITKVSRYLYQLILSIAILVIALSSCQKQPNPITDTNRPRRQLTEYFDKKYLLYKLPASTYANLKLNQSYSADKPVTSNYGVRVTFMPLGYADTLNLQYTHVYSSKCIYHTNDSVYKYAEVAFPNPCLTNDNVYANVKLSNTTNTLKQLFLKVFYQNTSYWYSTDSNYIQNDSRFLDNYYGQSEVVHVMVPPNTDTLIQIPYAIGMNPKGEFNYDPAKDPARPGNYEFMLAFSPNRNSQLLSAEFNLKTNNPFALSHTLNSSETDVAYVGAHHFKFVFLDEYFDGVNDLNPNHAYIAKEGKEKKLCDTCSGWYRAAIDEHWNNDAYFSGYIPNMNFVKADYGIKQTNCKIDSNGIVITIPASKRGEYKKTWGEVLFGQSFKYGHLTVRAKFAQMFNISGSPNGIIHNLWLYQRDPDEVDTTNPYHNLQNANGKQPYEIDFEIWSSMDGVNTMWDANAFINYSIVDYMRNPNVQLKPGEFKQMGNYKAERLNKRQAGIPGTELNREFFNSFHTYELYWYPDHVRFMLDGYETAVITSDMAAIPDKYMFLWIGSPLYQDGTYYAQSNIPFLKTDKHTIIDYIKIE